MKYVYDGDNVSVYKTSDNSLVHSYTSTETEANEETGVEAKTDITETHFGTSYSSVVKDKSVSYTTGNNTIAYSYQTTGSDEDEKVSSDTVKNGDSTALSSAYTYDDNGNVLKKAVTANGSTLDLVNTYDDKNRITSVTTGSKTVNYTYDAYSQLTGASGGGYSASYSYDSRGNITNKTVNGTSTTFGYSSDGWNDKLTSVNGTALTYDANGNVLTYCDKSFTWSSGRNLASITDGTNTYSYTYDENGIRTSKTVNGVTTYFNTKDGVILSQTDGTNTLYFQYDTSGVPLGFIYNGTQYLYMTNQMGDVIAILNTNGVVVGNYEYDAWGAVTLSDSNIANINPIRYRGYYYDAETEYYYLQSRYYNASICRFINADLPIYAKMQKGVAPGLNIFIYCCNMPTNMDDFDGFWGKSKHYDWTYSIAKDCGYSKNTAKKIAGYCKALDDDFPSTAYAKNFTLHAEEKEWQYYHFNKYKYGNKDSRTEYANKWLSKAIHEHYVGRYDKAYMWLGYALHCLQDIEAHGQIDRGDTIPDHLVNVNGDNRNKADKASGYEWTDSKKNKLKYVFGSKKRQNAAKEITKTYIKAFREATK